MILGDVFKPSTIVVHLESSEKEEAFEELIEQLVSADPSLDRTKLLNAIMERETLMSTGIKPGIAVPHGKTDAVKGCIGAIGISKSGVEYEALDNKPVHIIFMLLSSPTDSEYHLRVLSRLAQIIDSPAVYSELVEQTSAEQVYSLLCKYDMEI